MLNALDNALWGGESPAMRSGPALCSWLLDSRLYEFAGDQLCIEIVGRDRQG
jgi:hypothetical protein